MTHYMCHQDDLEYSLYLNGEDYYLKIHTPWVWQNETHEHGGYLFEVELVMTPEQLEILGAKINSVIEKQYVEKLALAEAIINGEL